MNKEIGKYLLQIYNQCRDLKFFFLEDDYHKILETLFYIIKNGVELDNIICVFVNEKENIFQYYSAIEVEESFVKQCLENHKNIQSYCYVAALKEHLGYFIFVRDSHDWDYEEKEYLGIVVDMYNHIFTNKNDYHNLVFKESVFINLLDVINGNIYITDPKTDEILFMNKTMKEAFGFDNPVGKTCWSLFSPELDERCPHCPIRYLEDHPHDIYTWENTEKLNNHVYINHDCMIEWLDHRLVHFQHSVDITELRRIQIDASYDELTGIYNRRAGKNALNHLLAKAKKENKDVVVCLYDLDNLKQTNDVYGHREGDYMLKEIANEVKKCLKSDDVFFRLSGDEFVIGFYDNTNHNVHAYMTEILHNLKILCIDKELKYALSYCYGLYKVRPSSTLGLSEIIVQADEKMYIRKKKSHLRNALEELKHSSPVVESFDYNKDLLYDALVKSTDDYIFICNLKTNVFKYTPQMVEEFDFPNEILTNAAAVFGSKIHKDDKYEFLNSNQLIADGRSDSHIVEYRALNKNNEWVWLRCHGHVEYDEHGEASIFAGFISNLGKKNYRDILTGLYNKFEFEKRVNEGTGHFAVIVLNIDGFKTINQLHDRAFGDNVLRIIGQNLQTMLHKEATVFKLDSDEFGLILKETNHDYIEDIYQRIQTYVLSPHTYEDKSFSCSFTGGVAIAPKDGNTYLELRKRCEVALQYGKRHKRQDLIFFKESLLEEKTFSLQLLTSLQSDIHNCYEYFHLVYQPKVASQTHHLIGFEALCRWQHPDFLNIGPNIFIPILENSHDIIALGEWIFEQAIIQLKEWLSFYPDLTMSINVSYIQLKNKEFISFVQSMIDKYQISYHNIIIELTETAIAKNTHSIIEMIKELRELGIRIAMDDFGTGYSSLSLLKDEPLDIIKVDQSFARDIKEDSFNYVFMKFIIELCHQLDLKVVIEGIETKEELMVVEGFKPDYIQGYYTGIPMNKEECLEFIQENIDIKLKVI